MFAWRHSIYLRLHLYIAVCIFLLMCDSFLRSWFIAIDCFLSVYIYFVACLEFATLEIVIFLAMCLAFFCLLSLRSLFAACVYSPILVCVAHLISICLSFTNITGVILPIELLQLITVVSLQSVFIHSCFLQFTFIYCSLLPVCTNYLTLSDTGLQLFAFWLIIFCLLVLFIY